MTPLSLSVSAHPDPLVSASVYCEGKLDELLYACLAPFWRHFSAAHPGLGCYLWLARYRRGGEHLKIRLHGPEMVSSTARSSLQLALEGFLDSLPPAQEDPLREAWSDQFPVDFEDEVDTAYPDRTILWTRYRRVPGIMGRQPMSADDLHAAHFTRCLGLGTEILLNRFLPGNEGTIGSNLRTSLALRFFVSSFLALDLPLEARRDCLCYHRDWLLASFQIDPEKALSRFDAQIAASPASVDQLASRLAGDGQAAEKESSYDEWREIFAGLVSHMLARVDKREFWRDPYLRDQVFAAPFKLLHAHCNVLGLGPVNEGYLSHLLLRATGDRTSESP